MGKFKASTLRALSALLFIAMVIASLALHTGFGTMSSFGIMDVSTLCPLGAIEAAIASRTVVPPMLIGVAVVALLTIVLGRFFCSWGCPIPLLRRVLGMKEFDDDPKRRKREKTAQAVAPEPGEEAELAGKDAPKPAAKLPRGLQRLLSRLDLPAEERGGAGDSRNWVLGGAILSTAAFGFPVFCLVCPVGLFFATVIVLWRLFHFAEISLSLVVFPLVLLVELVVLRKWCHRFCPLGALLSLIARLNKTFRPKVDTGACLKTSKGVSCGQCSQACSEGIDLHDALNSAPMNECLKCRSCSDACPAHAITFPLLARKQDRSVGQEALAAADASTIGREGKATDTTDTPSEVN